MHKLLILGATSPIARNLAREFAREGSSLYVAGRDAEEVRRVAADLRIRFQAPVSWGEFEASNFEGHERFLERVIQAMDGLTGVVLCFGDLGDQERATRDFMHSRRILENNFLGAASILTHVANYLESCRSGFIVGISSVAGDRGRQSNYVYGAAKGALSLFLQGLRNRLSPVGVRVLTVKLGFVDTGMSYGRAGSFLVASPGSAALSIYRAIMKSRDVVYLPWLWRPFMWFIRAIPERVFKHLRL